MSTLSAFMEAVSSGRIEVVDLTAPLSSETPIIQLPPDFGQTRSFALEEISRYDDRGPAWYWNNIVTGEHTGTHFDAPNHWVTGRDKGDVASVPVERLIAPAVVVDMSARAADDPDFLLEISDLEAWQAGARAAARRRLAAATAPAGTPDRRARRTSSTPTRRARTRRASRRRAPAGSPRSHR